MRQQDVLTSPKHSLVASPPVKWPQQPVKLIHPAVFPSFQTPGSVSPTTTIDLPPGAYSMITNKPSLFLLGFGLMLLGVCFFSSGFFLGMWIGGKSAGDGSTAQVASSGGGGGGPAASSSRVGTFLGLAGTAMGGKTGRLAFAGQRAANKEARQQPRAGASGGGQGHPMGAVSGSGSAATEMAADDGSALLEEEEGAGGPLSSVTYAIQLGSFVAKENAQDLVKRLKDNQFSVYLVESKDADGGPIFCVRSGVFNRFVFAETAIGKFSDQGISAIVVAVKPTDKRLIQ